MTREFGSEKRLPLAPAASRNAPIEAARPVHKVDTSGLMKFIVSKMARPADTEPPGELMYSEMSLSGFSLSRNSSWATMRLAIWSLTGPTRKITRSFSRRE